MKTLMCALSGIVMAIGLTACAGSDSEAGTPRVSSHPAQPTSSTSHTPTPVAAPTPAVPPAPYDTAVELVTCHNLVGESSTYATIHQVWEAKTPHEGECGVRLNDGGTLTELQKQALQAAYGEVKSGEWALSKLYAICTSPTDMSPESTIRVDTQQVAAALMLCPDHPFADRIRSNIEARDAIKAGEQVDSGKYLVGVDVQPGLWQSVGDKVSDCYWEISDAQGNIMENNFISIAPQFTITILDTASGFTVEGCAFRKIG
ncbi:hypothetical protein [Arthrobacter sunyaminii]|uniref:hypothetical protein n=1 Tax=Arthrobacter sunyaminii TaxID=2816859 RepID=UPI001A94FF3B|nr:hypothetical protein [Arthrobacter sunyaminii]MBO0898335.1 hypothetical protein [Arthrobacter sunyaminii]